MFRVMSTSLRIAWAYNEHNVRLALAAQIVVAAGTVVLLVVNTFFAQRLVRARQPQIGWNKVFGMLVPPTVIILCILSIAMIITAMVQSFYTLNPNTKRIDRDIQWAILSWFAFVAFLPMALVALIFIIPTRHPIDNLGSGRYGTKVAVVLAASTMLTLGAGYRIGTIVLPPVSVRSPTPWYYSKACFYCFDFMMEWLTVTMFLVMRIDRRFYIPNGAKGPGSYSLNATAVRPVDIETRIFTLNTGNYTSPLPKAKKAHLPAGSLFDDADADADAAFIKPSDFEGEVLNGAGSSPRGRSHHSSRSHEEDPHAL